MIRSPFKTITRKFYAVPPKFGNRIKLDDVNLNNKIRLGNEQMHYSDEMIKTFEKFRLYSMKDRNTELCKYFRYIYGDIKRQLCLVKESVEDSRIQKISDHYINVIKNHQLVTLDYHLLEYYVRGMRTLEVSNPSINHFMFIGGVQYYPASHGCSPSMQPMSETYIEAYKEIPEVKNIDAIEKELNDVISSVLSPNNKNFECLVHSLEHTGGWDNRPYVQRNHGTKYELLVVLKVIPKMYL